MASSDEVIEDWTEVDQQHPDPERPGITWRRGSTTYTPGPCDELEATGWSGTVGLTCSCRHDWLGVRWLDDPSEETEARAELEAIADAHLLEAHPQRSLFDGGPAMARP